MLRKHADLPYAFPLLLPMIQSLIRVPLNFIDTAWNDFHQASDGPFSRFFSFCRFLLENLFGVSQRMRKRSFTLCLVSNSFPVRSLVVLVTWFFIFMAPESPSTVPPPPSHDDHLWSDGSCLLMVTLGDSSRCNDSGSGRVCWRWWCSERKTKIIEGRSANRTKNRLCEHFKGSSHHPFFWSLFPTVIILMIILFFALSFFFSHSVFSSSFLFAHFC